MTSPTIGQIGSGSATRDDRVTIAELRRQLLAERERSLNATDRVLGAQAEAAQARAEIKELRYALHVRDAELARAEDLIDHLRATAPAQAPSVGQQLGRVVEQLRLLAERARR